MSGKEIQRSHPSKEDKDDINTSNEILNELSEILLFIESKPGYHEDNGTEMCKRHGTPTVLKTPNEEAEEGYIPSLA
jgi:hypothetical protein